MPTLRAGLMKPLIECVPKNAVFLDDQGLSRSQVGERLIEWRHCRLLVGQGARLSRLDSPKTQNERISRKRAYVDGQQRRHSQHVCQSGFNRRIKGQDPGIQSGIPELQFGPASGAAKVPRKVAKAVTSSTEEASMGFANSKKDPTSKFSLRAVIDDREASRDEEQEIYEFDQSDRLEKKQGTTVISKGRLGLYATTTAIAIQDSLPPEGLIVLMSCGVGLMTGVSVVLFNLGVHEIHDIVWKGIPYTGASWLRTQSLENTWQQIVLVPAGGGVVVGLLNTVLTSLKGPKEEHSIWRNAKLFIRQVLKTGAAAITLGTGSSLGPEGPSVEIGASIANGVATVLRNSRGRKLSLVAAGSAAGISSGFNAAVAGCFFAVESVLSGLSSADSAPSLTTAMVLLSSVLASVVSRTWLGSDPAFRIPAYDFRSPTELPLYLLLGVLCGGVSVALAKCTAYATTLFESFQKSTGVPAGFLPPLGGFCVGVIALVYPEVLYWGFENVDVLLESHLPWVQGPPAILLLQLVGAKLVATSLCRASGLVGGVYTPSLFIGAALGSAYGSVASYASLHADPRLHLDVLQVAAPQAYALVGMAATLAGVCQVPLTSVLLLFELTGDYRIILPLMAAVGLSSWVAFTFQRKKTQPVVQIEVPVTPGGVVSLTRSRAGSGSQALDAIVMTDTKQPSSPPPPFPAPPMKRRVPGDNELCSLEDTLCLTNSEISEDLLTDEILVISAMRTRYIALTGDSSLGEAMARLLSEKEWCVLIVNLDKHLEGLLTLSDIQRAAEEARSSGLELELDRKPISSLCKSVSASGEVQVVTAHPEMTLKAAQRLMAGRGLRQIPVIGHHVNTDGKTSGKPVVGLLDREGIQLACRAEATRRMLCFPGPLKVQPVPDGTNVF